GQRQRRGQGRWSLRGRCRRRSRARGRGGLRALTFTELAAGCRCRKRTVGRCHELASRSSPGRAAMVITLSSGCTTRFSGFGKPFDGNRRVFRRPVLWGSRPQLVEQLFERAHDIRVPRDEELAARAGGAAALDDRTGFASDELACGVVPRVEG